MRRATWLVFFTAALAAATPSTHAIEPWLPAKLESATTELSLWASLDIRDVEASWLWLGGDIGYLLSPRHEVGATVSLQFWVLDWETAVGAAGGGFYRFNVPARRSKLVPFVGARGIGNLGDFASWDVEIRAEGGVRRFVNGHVAITLTGFFGRSFGPRDHGWTSSDGSNRFGATVGLSALF